MSTNSQITNIQDAEIRSKVDRSLRHPVMFFFTSGAAWLALSIIFGLVASLKTHNPSFLGECSWLQYGRLFPTHINLLIYGWGAQASFGVMIWLMARLSRKPSRNAGTILAAGHVWNFAVGLGMIGILSGHGTGKHWMNFPTFVWPVLLVAYAAIAIWVLVTFRVRRSEPVFISQWYLLGALFWFPWVFLTANLFVNVFDIHPVMAAAINGWFRHALIFLFFTPVAIASAYYISAKVTGRSIYNSTIATGGFWALAIVAPWAGMQSVMGSPLPDFLEYVGAAASILVAVPLIIAGANILKTSANTEGAVAHSPSLRFTIAGTFGMLLLAFSAVVLGFPSSIQYTQFTIANYGFDVLALYGFFTMTMFGAIYFIVPRVTLREWVFKRWMRTHFWFSVYGVLFIFLFCVLLGGFQQGAVQREHLQPWESVVRSSLPFSVGTTVAWGFLLFANVFFFLHLTLMWLRLGRRSSHPTLLNRPHGHGTPHGPEGDIEKLESAGA